MLSGFSIFPLGDSALVIDFGNRIDHALNVKVRALYEQLFRSGHPAIIDLVPAYSSLAVYYNIAQVAKHSEEHATAFDAMSEWLEQQAMQISDDTIAEPRLLRIPVCYASAYAPDLAALAIAKNLAVEEVIHIHTEKVYEVYMIGFLPGFAYMADVDQRLVVPRHAQPRAHVAAGSIGIAGAQTGIYPIDSPGGWQIIGRTPVTIFDYNKADPVLFKPGDRVQFYPISENEFADY
jgi:inhibitor of KinA